VPGDERVRGCCEPPQARRAFGDQVDLRVATDLAYGCLAVRVGVEAGDPGVAPDITGLVEALRGWYDQADIWTWRWLRVQTGCFIAGAACLLVVPVSFY
jgi:hypothetical protein